MKKNEWWKKKRYIDISLNLVRPRSAWFHPHTFLTKQTGQRIGRSFPHRGQLQFQTTTTDLHKRPTSVHNILRGYRANEYPFTAVWGSVHNRVNLQSKGPAVVRSLQQYWWHVGRSLKSFFRPWRTVDWPHHTEQIRFRRIPAIVNKSPPAVIQIHPTSFECAHISFMHNHAGPSFYSIHRNITAPFLLAQSPELPRNTGRKRIFCLRFRYHRESRARKRHATHLFRSLSGPSVPPQHGPAHWLQASDLSDRKPDQRSQDSSDQGSEDSSHPHSKFLERLGDQCAAHRPYQPQNFLH
jgi:hypothetical protein